METLNEWLHYIETIHPQSIVFGLDRIRLVAKRLNVLEFSCPVVTIGGTNGKGSCVAIIEAIMIQSGYRVGAYTSPHLMQFNERIRLNNQMVDDVTLCEAFCAVEKAREKTLLTYFEFSTLVALYIFKTAKPDIILLEVGMGGRLDAVNIIDPSIAIISTISLDHTKWLGSSREAIGLEKAGIIRAGRPIICGDYVPPHSVIERAKILKANLYLLGHDFHYSERGDHWEWQSGDWSFKLSMPALPTQNVATALRAVQLLSDNFKIDEETVKQCAATTKIWGRFQRIKDDFILDVAHNPAATKWLFNRINALELPGQIHAVVGMLAEKDIENTLLPLKPLISQWYVCDLAEKRAASAHLLKENLKNLGVVKCKTYPSVKEGLSFAIKEKNTDDVILVFGSFHTVSDALKILDTLD